MNASEKIARSFAKATEHRSPGKHDYNKTYTYDDIIRSGLPWLELSINIPTSTILKEINNIQHLFVDHRSDYSNNGWSAFCIHGKSYDATREDGYYDDDRAYDWTKEARELMPNTVDYFKTHWFNSQFQRLRVMRLDPGAIIEVHRDREDPGLHEINLAITQPDACRFIMEGNGVVPFGAGKGFLLDVSNRHAVINDSEETRYHIIIHQTVISPEFKKMVELSYHRQYTR
jgi:hypothetical protein